MKRVVTVVKRKNGREKRESIQVRTTTAAMKGRAFFMRSRAQKALPGRHQ